MATNGLTLNGGVAWRLGARVPKAKAGAIAVAIAGLTAAHFASVDTGPQRGIHVILQASYLLPVLAGAVWFGLIGGIVTSVGVALGYSLHLVHWWPREPYQHIDQTAMVLIFVVVGPITGFLVELERRERQRRREQETRFERAALVQSVAGLVAALRARNPSTVCHSERVAALAGRLGRVRGLPAARVEVLELAGLVHDLGKIGIPEEILAKPDALTPEERDVIERHPRVAADILSHLVAAQEIARVVLCHHEQPDGRGYPVGLRTEQIPVEAALLKVADAYCALTDRRAYRDALPSHTALSWIQQRAGTEFDLEAVKTLAVVVGTVEAPAAVSAKNVAAGPAS